MESLWRAVYIGRPHCRGVAVAHMNREAGARRGLRLSSPRVILIALVLLGLGLWLLQHFVERSRTQLHRVFERGALRVATLNSPTTYYEGPDGEPRGLEYDLASAFAEQLGVELELVVADSYADVMPLVFGGEVDFAAAGLAAGRDESAPLRYSSSYQSVEMQLVERQGKGDRDPRSITDLIDLQLEVVAGGSASRTLREMRQRYPYPPLAVDEHADINAEELLERVARDEAEYAVVSSTAMQVLQHVFPELRVAFELPQKRRLAWGFQRLDGDDSLFRLANEFIDGIRANGRLTQFIERYYGHVREFDYAGTRLYMKRIEKRLPEYRELFREVAAEHGLDWRLLAAIAHQESQWDPRAVSPTGVRGMMMLTRATAGQLGIENRLDPEQSVRGGARYLIGIRERLAEEIVEPDRTWMALAAYNVGYGHLRDAQKIAVARDMDPYKWIDVQECLPLLSKRRWYSELPHGYARGREPVVYVQNIRRYYDILVWHTDREREHREAGIDSVVRRAR